MDLTAQLLHTAATFSAATGMSRARFATIVINDGKFFDRVERGGGLTVKTFEKFLQFFSDRWPEGPDAPGWPEGVMRPAPVKAGAAA